MSYFDVSPVALKKETVAEWLTRTEEARKSGWSLAPSLRKSPRKKFLISEWIDPKLSPLPIDKEYIWGKFSWETFDGLHVFSSRRPSRKGLAFVRPLQDIHEIAVICDVRDSLASLEKNFKTAVNSHREQLAAQRYKVELNSYSGAPNINYKGIYDDYVEILRRLDDGESEEDIRFTEYRGAERQVSGESYHERLKKQIPKAISLRDGGYKDIAYRDDFFGSLKPNKD